MVARFSLRRCAAGLHRLLPCACALCGAVQRDLVCAGCRIDLAPLLTRHRCPRCAQPFGQGYSAPECPVCLDDPPDFAATIAWADYAWPLDRLVAGLKFHAQLAWAAWLAEQLGDALRAAPGALPEVLLPVPLSARRLRQRGYNQAWELARRLGARLGIPARPDVLRRLRDSPAQSGLNRALRLTNLRGAFEASRGAWIAGCHVGVVDDVMTTGATLAEIAAQLTRAGARRVSNYVVLRTP